MSDAGRKSVWTKIDNTTSILEVLGRGVLVRVRRSAPYPQNAALAEALTFVPGATAKDFGL